MYRSKNPVANLLAQAASSLEPLAMQGLKKFTMELVSTPAVPDNIKNFQVFDDDKQILDFLTSSGVFEAQIIDEEETEEAEFDTKGILNLKTNVIPKGMVELERLFDPDKLSRNQSTQGNDCEAVNLGTEG